MMYWYGHGMGWAWGGGLLMFGFWVLVAVAVVLAVRHFSRSGGRPPSAGPPPSAEQLLAERYARGEIDDEEYQRRLATLRGGTPAGSGGPGGR
jgi:putative membrane protein